VPSSIKPVSQKLPSGYFTKNQDLRNFASRRLIFREDQDAYSVRNRITATVTNMENRDRVVFNRGKDSIAVVCAAIEQLAHVKRENLYSREPGCIGSEVRSGMQSLFACPGTNEVQLHLLAGSVTTPEFFGHPVWLPQ
jgi:hypothetical protein